MPQSAQSKGADIPARYQQHQRIGEGGLPAMQQMKTDTATIGIKDGIGQQMVEIDQIGACDNQACQLPALAPQKRGNQERDEPMPAIVQNGLEEVQFRSPFVLSLSKGECSCAPPVRTSTGSA